MTSKVNLVLTIPRVFPDVLFTKRDTFDPMCVVRISQNVIT